MDVVGIWEMMEEKSVGEIWEMILVPTELKKTWGGVHVSSTLW